MFIFHFHFDSRSRGANFWIIGSIVKIKNEFWIGFIIVIVSNELAFIKIERIIILTMNR